jgi:NADH-quinone oxidoreductase subunit J
MRSDILFASLIIALGASGTYLLLPHRHAAARPRSVHATGYGLVGLSLLLMALLWTPPGPFLASLFFYVFALAAVAGGVLMITSRDPVYSALWFASVVLSTSGLFLLSGAQFLAAGTVIVYAGAIIVTFLFVIMLAQAEGQALYDRAARSPARATFSFFILLWSLMYIVLMAKKPEGPALDQAGLADRLIRTDDWPGHAGVDSSKNVSAVVARSVSPMARLTSQPAKDGVPAPHVAGLGGTLFTDHLISVEVAGAILFVALVGAAAIATPKPPVRPAAPV